MIWKTRMLQSKSMDSVLTSIAQTTIAYVSVIIFILVTVVVLRLDGPLGGTRKLEKKNFRQWSIKYWNAYGFKSTYVGKWKGLFLLVGPRFFFLDKMTDGSQDVQSWDAGLQGWFFFPFMRNKGRGQTSHTWFPSMISVLLQVCKPEYIYNSETVVIIAHRQGPIKSHEVKYEHLRLANLISYKNLTFQNNVILQTILLIFIITWVSYLNEFQYSYMPGSWRLEVKISSIPPPLNFLIIAANFILHLKGDPYNRTNPHV
jgi:hypothetical protein